MRAFLGLAVVLGLTSASTSAADLAKIDRTIHKLPAFRSPTPRYCLLVFGPKAETRIWAVVDDQHLYLDRNGNGDLTEPGERISRQYNQFKVDRLTEQDGKTTHTNLIIWATSSSASIHIQIHGRLHQQAFHDARGRLVFGGTPGTAPIVHFNGPVTLDSFWVQKPLTSAREQRLSVVVGTHGVGPGTFAIFPCDCILTGGKAPEADIEFPHRDPTQPPLRRHVKLDED